MSFRLSHSEQGLSLRDRAWDMSHLFCNAASFTPWPQMDRTVLGYRMGDVRFSGSTSCIVCSAVHDRAAGQDCLMLTRCCLYCFHDVTTRAGSLDPIQRHASAKCAWVHKCWLRAWQKGTTFAWQCLGDQIPATMLISRWSDVHMHIMAQSFDRCAKWIEHVKQKG